MDWIRGKHAVITGPTSGIGQQIALDLGHAGAHVVLACRDTVKGAQVGAAVVRAGAASVAVLPIDTSSSRSIEEFARRYRERSSRLEVLVNNAGVSYSARVETAEGIEMTFGTNVLGYHRVTKALQKLLGASAPARVVNVASMFASNLDLDDLQFTRRPYDGLPAYAQSKACDRLLTWAWARRLQRFGITVNAMAPGFVQTGLTRNLSPGLRQAYSTRAGRPVRDGADTAVWLAASREVEGITGTFFYDRREVPCEFRDTEVEERLWEICESFYPSQISISGSRQRV
jgi:NAD(P)-dependent dehydrogenase (short-subunit alcohol dehydrogenase family)